LPSFFSSFIWAAVLLRSLAVAMLFHKMTYCSLCVMCVLLPLLGPVTFLTLAPLQQPWNSIALVERRCQNAEESSNFENSGKLFSYPFPLEKLNLQKKKDVTSKEEEIFSLGNKFVFCFNFLFRCACATWLFFCFEFLIKTKIRENEYWLMRQVILL
jgi:hypothetical protein